MPYSATEISNIVNGEILIQHNVEYIEKYVFDTRLIFSVDKAIFLCIQTNRNDGHKYAQQAYNKGVRTFLIDKEVYLDQDDITIIKVDHVLQSLQLLAKYHRTTYHNQVLAITGSNGKTIIKEWLYDLLKGSMKISKTSKSYNSQLGVALSLLNIDQNDDLVIIEAGISKPGEMSKLEDMIQPTIGLFSNIGEAHQNHFESIEQKIQEKLTLFKSCSTIIYNGDDHLIHPEINVLYPNKNLINWGEKNHNSIKILSSDSNKIKLAYKQHEYVFNISKLSTVFLENIFHVISTLLFLGKNNNEIQDALNDISIVPSRLETVQGKDNSIIINDSYTSDLDSMKLAVAHLNSIQSKERKIIILSEFDQQNSDEDQFGSLGNLLQQNQLDEIHFIGSIDLSSKIKIIDKVVKSYSNTNQLISQLTNIDVRNSAILIKGARKHKLENVVHALSTKVHGTTFSLSLNALNQNVLEFKNVLKKDIKLLLVIKASAYGSDSEALIDTLKSLPVDVFAVATIDEGIAMRQAGIEKEIIIFNPQVSGIFNLLKYNLTAVVSSYYILHALTKYPFKISDKINIHIEFDTGMYRLGFNENDIDPILAEINDTKEICLTGLMSHLSSSEDENEDEFSFQQINRFQNICESIERNQGHTLTKHMLNSAGIIRFRNHQFDMVRLGISMYGITPVKNHTLDLQAVHKLSTVVLQVKNTSDKATIGYNRKGRMNKAGKIAIIAIGYADGLMRIAGNGNFSVLINGKLAPIIGNVSMDTTIIDITHIPDVMEGDEVIIFDENYSIDHLAKACKTISYEILSRIAPRVKRSYLIS